MRADDTKKKSYISAYTNVLKPSNRALVGQERYLDIILSTFLRPELCNVLLLGEAGIGKTSLVRGLVLRDKTRFYLEVDLAKMINDSGDNPEKVSGFLKLLFDEVKEEVKKGVNIVLFIDEFHQLVNLSKSATEVIKPLLAESGVNDIRVIVATTYKEFQDLIKENAPLVERLQEVHLAEPDKATVVKILQGMVSRYKVSQCDESIFGLIYDYTNRYAPANAQPRKSILILDAMMGKATYSNRVLDKNLLAETLKDSLGVNVNFKVDGSTIKKRLDQQVFDQDFVTTIIEEHLQLCVADLHNPDKPLASFLFAGASGVGKTEVSKTLADILFEDKRALIRFDMTEFANSDSFNRFKKELTRRVSERPNAIIMFDEIEKSCREITLLLLQVLDDARLLDEFSREVSFKNTYIIMTTNAGTEIYEDIAREREKLKNSVSDFKSEEGLLIARYSKLIRSSLVETQGNRFPQELLGRIDVIVPFANLSESALLRIAERCLTKLSRRIYEKHKKQFTFDYDVVRFIVGDKLGGNADKLGARQVVSSVVNIVDVAVSKIINQNPNATRIHAKMSAGLQQDDKTQLISRAKVIFDVG